MKVIHFSVLSIIYLLKNKTKQKKLQYIKKENNFLFICGKLGSHLASV